MSSGQAAQAISAIVNEEIAAGHLVGGVVVLGINDRIVLRQAYGQRSVTPDVKPATLDTIYDAASLTKVMATSIAIMQLVEQGKIDLDQPVATYWPAFAANGKGAITVRQLMTHYGGLPAGIPTRGWSDYQGALDTIVALKPQGPPGTRFNYSDVDFIVLGELVRRVSGQPLDIYAAQHIFQPLGMRDTTFLPSPTLKNRIAPSDLQGSELRWGDVHDPLAYRMGGVAGQAGVFTTADDLTKFAQMMLAGGQGILKPASVTAMTTPQSPPGGAALRGLGWDIDSPYAVWFAPSFST
ncbi:MAG TPA: serine hydrolase domain-containing protein, partial [Reyranella sp.]